MNLKHELEIICKHSFSKEDLLNYYSDVYDIKSDISFVTNTAIALRKIERESSGPKA